MKSIGKQLALGLFLLLAGVSITLSQTSGQTDQPQPGEEETADKETAGSTPPQPGEVSETFRPSEDISEDLSVSFPVDI